MCACLCVWGVHSAFDTLSKVLHPSEEGIEQRLANKSLQCVGGTTIHLIGRDQETPIIEVEGPLLTDSHVGFKVKALELVNTSEKSLLRCYFGIHFQMIILSLALSLFV